MFHCLWLIFFFYLKSLTELALNSLQRQLNLFKFLENHQKRVACVQSRSTSLVDWTAVDLLISWSVTPITDLLFDFAEHRNSRFRFRSNVLRRKVKNSAVNIWIRLYLSACVGLQMSLILDYFLIFTAGFLFLFCLWFVWILWSLKSDKM